MSTKRKTGNDGVVPGNSKQAQNTSWRGFVNIDMTVAQKDAAIKLSVDGLAFWSAVEGVLLSGYRIGLSYSQRENVYTATCTGMPDHETDAGIAVSARASSADKAVAAVMIKLEGAKFALAPLFEGTTFRPVDL